MTNVRALLKEARKLEAERTRGREKPDIPTDPVEFAKSLGIVPDPWQMRLLRSASSRVLLNCARQSGKSTMAALIALHHALRRPGALVLILAPSERQAKETFAEAARFYRNLGYPITSDSDRKTGLELSTRSRIEALPGSSERTIRGFSGVDLLIVDEAARVADELYYAVRPMLAVSGGTLMLLSTPFGRQGVFYEEWENGQGWERYEVTAAECPRISEAFLEEERLALGPWWFAQEYECRFMDTVDQVFATEAVERAMRDDIKPITLGAS